ncbi:MAG: tetratricopeptide repeat protein [Methylococcales bacterium]|nr:tetratricopeptide repeat protein [Methylococcales bacterium]
MIRLLSLLLSLFLLSPVFAKDKPTTLPERLYKKLEKTEKLISKKSYRQAEEELKNILTSVKPNSYGQAVVFRSLSSVYALNGQYKKAAKALSECLALKVLPENQEQQAVLNLGQLYMAVEQYKKAIEVLKPWLTKNSSSDASINALVANAYTQLKQYRKALPYIKKAISQSKKPNEPWYQLNLALYYQLENYSSAAEILKTLIRLHPNKKQYWGELSSTYQQLKQYQKALSIQQLAYKKNILTDEKEILSLANLFLYTGAPYKSATLLDYALKQKKIKNTSKNWETLANSWQMAKEFDHAINALETASKLNSIGSLYQQLGSIHVSQEKWDKAIASLNKAISKGGLKNKGNTYLLLGMSYFELNNLKEAKQSFLHAAQYSKTKKEAMQWLHYIQTPNQKT